ncbi:hypothetical protein [Streptomyces sp. IMTB 2501]|nr:hypothetical protein [Streptomyces sp. IMTB 2501]
MARPAAGRPGHGLGDRHGPRSAPRARPGFGVNGVKIHDDAV